MNRMSRRQRSLTVHRFFLLSVVGPSSRSQSQFQEEQVATRASLSWSLALALERTSQTP